MSVVPNNVIDLLDNLQNEFIWSGKKAKIKHSTLIGDFNQGGLKKVDIVTKIQSLQLSWIKRLLDDNFHPWKVIPTVLLANAFPNSPCIFFPNFAFKTNNSINKLPLFYKNILNFWVKFSS